MNFRRFHLIVFLSALFIFAACSDSKKNEDETTGDQDSYSDSDTSGDAELPDADSDPHEETEPDADNAEEPEERTKSPDFEDLECGHSFGDYACDFTLPTDSGDWNFAENYSKNDNYILVFYRSMNTTSSKIWGTSLYNLFDKAPENIHYFFIVDSGKSSVTEEKIQTIKASVKDAYDVVGNEKIFKNMHIVTKPASEADPWIAELIENNKSDFFFGIDRERRIRKGGSMSGLDDIYKEAEYYDYEKKISVFIEENASASTVFKGLEGVPFEEEGWTKNIDFEIDFKGLSENGRLYIMLEQICSEPKKCEWDRLERLFLCDETGEKCETETGRWITTYGRSGKWLTDITPLKPMFEKDGKYKFRFTVDGDYYVNNLDFIFVKEAETAGNALVPLFNQREQFDENYNSHFEPMKIEISGDIKKAKIFAYITGHGNASEEANCAEFCQFESVFTVNGTDFKIRFDKAGTTDGCFEEVRNGVVPNQYGTWPYGRAGWCPGKNVTLLEADVSEVLASGENIFSYAAYLDGKVYVPVVTNENGYRAEIYLSSFLALYK